MPISVPPFLRNAIDKLRDVKEENGKQTNKFKNIVSKLCTGELQLGLNFNHFHSMKCFKSRSYQFCRILFE